MSTEPPFSRPPQDDTPQEQPQGQPYGQPPAQTGYWAPPPAPGQDGGYPPHAYPQQPYWSHYQQPPVWGLPAEYQVQFRDVPAWGWLAALGVAMLGLLISALFGEHWNFVVGAAQAMPFALLGLLAYLGKRHSWALVLAGVFLNLFLLVVFLGTIGMAAVAVMAKAGLLTEGRPGPMRLPPGGLAQVGGVIFWCLGAWVSGVLVVLPPVRRLLTRILPIDPDSPVHALGLATVVPLTVVGFGQLIATGGRPALLTLVQSQPDAIKANAQDLIVGMALAFLWLLPCALVTVGWPLMRSFGEALQRIGWVRPTWKQVAGGIGVAVAMVFVFQGLDAALNALWEWTRWPKTDVSAFEQLMKPLITPTGAVLIGITAGIGEEVVVRGVLQPRLGLWLSNLFFVSLHAFQYGFDGLLSVFAAGLVLGVLKNRTNTTTSALAHGTYDFILVFYTWFVGGTG